MPQKPTARYTLIRSEEYTEQLQRMIDNGAYTVLNLSLPGVLHAISLRAEIFPQPANCGGLRAAKSDGAGVEPPFSVWFHLDGGLVTLRGITYFNIPPTGLWDDD